VSWFDILKELQSRAGYAQLDFDNIVEEEEDNCKKRWQRIGNALDKKTKETIAYFTEKVYGKEPKETTLGQYIPSYVKSGMRFDFEDDSKTRRRFGYTDMIIFYHYYYDAELPEEIYCKALDYFDRKVNSWNQIKEYTIMPTFKTRKMPMHLFLEGEALEYDRKIYVYLEDKLMASLGFRIMVRVDEEELLNNLVKMFEGVIT
tara:strand:+ start:101 stop:709 length:609 start_codon:yes stop_codon:yes gene_type:complete